MEIRHFTINITSEECGHPRTDELGADLTAYLLSPLSHAPARRRPAVIVCPGGAYRLLSDREDQPIAMQYLAAGCQVFILHYHVSPETFPLALMELARSVALVREHAKRWNIDPKKILVSGFSAGGHLACSLGAFWNRPVLFESLGLKASNIQPNGMILCYPVITSGEHAHKESFLQLLGLEDSRNSQLRSLVSLELQVGPHTPRTFLWHTWSDASVPVENSLLLAQALKKANVNLELHIYPQGRHGLSLANEEVSGPKDDYMEPRCQGWISLAVSWLKEYYMEDMPC